MSGAPTISVILPVYNGEAFLSEAIESLLAQTVGDLELVIVDDGSTDCSRQISSRFAALDNRISLVCEDSNRGVVNSLNTALRAVRGEFIARLDQDDIALPERFETQLAFLRAHSSAVLVGSNMALINESGAVVGECRNPEFPDHIRFGMLLNNSIADPTVMCRTECVRSNALQYDSRWLGAEDYDLWTRLIRYGDAYNLQDSLTKYRCHPRQMSKLFAERLKVSAESISAAQIRALDPELTLPWDERKILNWLFRFCLSVSAAQNSGRQRIGPILEEATAQLATELPESYWSVFNRVYHGRVLQRLARRFVQATASTDTLLTLLAHGDAGFVDNSGGGDPSPCTA